MNPVQLFKSLSDETRLRCLLLIQREGELCVCELTGALQLSQPKISRHLARLKDDGVLQDRRQGQWVYYQLAEGLPEWARGILEAASASQPDCAHADSQRLQTLGNRPQRKRLCC